MSDDVDIFLQTVENILIVNDIPREEWVSLLVPQLVGKAQEAYSKLLIGVSNDYDAVEAAILLKHTDKDLGRLEELKVSLSMNGSINWEISMTIG